MGNGPSLTNMTNGDGQPITRLRIGMRQTAGDPAVNFLTNPSRMTIDFRAAPDMQFPKVEEIRHDLLKSFRGGLTHPGDRARIVVDMKDLPKGFDPRTIKTGYEKAADGKLYFNIDFPGAFQLQSQLVMRGKPAPRGGPNMAT